MSSAGAFVTVIFILIVAAIVFHLRKNTNHDILESSFTKLVVALIVATIRVQFTFVRSFKPVFSPSF